MTRLPATVREEPRLAPPVAPPPSPGAGPDRRGLTPGLLFRAGVGVTVAALVALPIGLAMALAMTARAMWAMVRSVAGRRG